MEFKFTINTDNLNDPDDIESTVENIKLLIRFLQRANPNYYLIGDELYNQLQEQLKQPAKTYPICIADSLDKKLSYNDIFILLNINITDRLMLRIVKDYGSKRKDAHTPNIEEQYAFTDGDVYNYLDDLLDSEDSKNGYQIYEEEDGTRYLQITGANFYDKNNEYAGTNNVKVYFKEFSWQ